jgi:hypothetical protein
MRWPLAKKRNWGMLLLAVWLILTGLGAFVQLGFVQLNLILAVLALAAGVLILLGR